MQDRMARNMILAGVKIRQNKTRRDYCEILLK